MVAITKAASLTFLKEDLKTNLNTAASRLEWYLEEPDRRASIITDCTAAFHQIGGVVRMLELPGASLLANGMETLTKRLDSVSDPEAAITALGNAVVLLDRYLEYVQTKGRQMPVLVLDGINELRRLNGQQLVPESTFFKFDLTPERHPVPTTGEAKPEEVPAMVRRMRHMYQIALIGVIRDQNHAINLKMMSRSLSRIDGLCPPGSLSKLLWIARAAVETLLKDKPDLNKPRKALLGQFDRLLKRLVYEGLQGAQMEIPDEVLKTSLSLVALSGEEDGVIGEVKQAFSLNASASGFNIQQEKAIMASGGETINTVISALNEELEEIRKALDFAAQGAVDTDYSEIAARLLRIANTLQIIEDTEEVSKIKQQAKIANSWKNQQPDPDSDEFREFVDKLLLVENAMAMLRKEAMPDDDVRKEAHNKNISLYQLDDARMAVVSECRGALSLAKRSVSAYAEDKDPMHLSNLPNSLGSVSGSMTFLDLPKAKAIAVSALGYIKAILNAAVDAPTHEQMETLADALTSLDYYLESMEEQKPIGESILDVAEMSLADLGFPVAT